MNLFRFVHLFYAAIDCIRDTAEIDFSSAQNKVSALLRGGSANLDSLAADPCVDALEDAIMKYGRPEITNTDQGNQFTSLAFIDLFQENSIQVSIDVKGCWCVTCSTSASQNQ